MGEFNVSFCNGKHQGHGYVDFMRGNGKCCSNAYQSLYTDTSKACSKYVDGCLHAALTRTSSPLKNVAQTLFMRLFYGIANLF